MKTAKEILDETTKGIGIVSEQYIIKAMEKFATQFEDDNGRANYYEDKIDLMNRINVTDNKTITKLEREMHLNMQYYMEHCQAKGYCTPQDWIKDHKHF